MLFYIPRWLWKNWESGKINALKMDLDLGIISEAEKRQKKKLLLDYLYSNLKNHNFWAYRYFFCEFLALINVFGKKTFFYHGVQWFEMRFHWIERGKSGCLIGFFVHSEPNSSPDFCPTQVNFPAY